MEDHIKLKTGIMTDCTGEKFKVSLALKSGSTADYCGECPEGGVSASIVERDSVRVIRISGRWNATEPYFGRQRYFSRSGGIVLELGDVESENGLVAVYQHKDWWLRPAFVRNAAELPERTQLLLWKRDGMYHAMSALCGEALRSDLSGGENGLCLTISSNCESLNEMEDLVLAEAEGEDPYSCCEKAVKELLGQLGRPGMFRGEKTFPDRLRYFGWCSWDAFYHEVSEKGILDKLNELKEKDVPVKWVLIDDGWLDADYKKQALRGLDADPVKFPDGLAGAVSKIKENYQADSVGVWHAAMGYWNGVEAGSPADEALGPYEEILPDGRHIPSCDAGLNFQFWNCWHDYLRNHCGIDFVKVDGQSAVSLYQWGRMSYGTASAGAQKGLGASAAMNFQNNIINCMGMAPEDMWNRPTSAIARSSDDFVPEVPHGFREHAIQNSYNSLLSGQFYWGDWDMFWSSHEENWQNSILRAVSGGPVYISDKTGATDPQYIMPLVLNDGLVLRCENTGVPTTDCLFEDPVRTVHPLKIFNWYKDCALVAALNINGEDKACEAVLRKADVPGLQGKSWWVHSWKAGALSELNDTEAVKTLLKPNDGEIFLLIPQSADLFTPIGLLDKYLSVAAVQTASIGEDCARLLLKQGGRFGFVCKGHKPVVRVNGSSLPIQNRGGFFWEAQCMTAKDQDVFVDIMWEMI